MFLTHLKFVRRYYDDNLYQIHCAESALAGRRPNFISELTVGVSGAVGSNSGS